MDLETQVQSNQAQSDQAWSGVKAEKGRVLQPEPSVCDAEAAAFSLFRTR